MTLGMKDPRRFWSTINQMNNWGKEHANKTDRIKPATWAKYFRSLLNKDCIHPPEESLQLNSSNEIKPQTFDPILDRRIEAKELLEAIHQLKSNKAAGPDRVLVEYNKVFAEIQHDVLLKIVRQIFSKHIYPSVWNLNLLKPIYKKGEADDPDNFRGLAIGSAFAKRFSVILLKRLNKYIEDKHLISTRQIGFMKGSRTSDHIFLLQTIIEKVVRKNKNKLYAVFIDFKKAYDTIDREKRFSRLTALGINGTFLRNIISMYKDTKYNIKLRDGF